LRANPGSSAGFTLIELLVALVIIAILGLAALNQFVAQHQAYVAQNAGVRLEQNARAGFDMLVREARNAGYDPRGITGATITHWTTDSFGWTADLNADGDLNDEGEDVLYFFQADPGTLVRREQAVDVEVTDGVINLSFAYFADPDGTAAQSVASIELLTVSMTYRMPKGTLPGALRTQVAVRNAIYE
jgi:prepilin-type N-terminal cleavage/methylation domain-containing protein